MNQKNELEKIKNDLLECLDETFENHHGIYLDKGTSLFATLEDILTEEAARRLTETGATIAAHVEHLRLYTDVLERAMKITSTNCYIFRLADGTVNEITE